VPLVGAFSLLACTPVSPEVPFPSASSLDWTDAPLILAAEDEFQAEFYEAYDFYLREQFEWVLDAHEPGELLEHATLTQIALERGIFDNEDLFNFGDELFEYEFRPENGFGDKLSGSGPTIHRVHRARIGGPDAFSCSGCHSKGGLDGAGASTQNAYFVADGDQAESIVVRNPPHLLGQGPIEALAREMTIELQAHRSAAVQTATTTMRRGESPLIAKGVDFGVLKVSAEGVIDASGVEGVSADLIVRPFGWKGRHASIREVVEVSFRVHLGVLSSELQEKVRQGVLRAEDYGGGDWYDLDQDGVSLEIEDGMLTSVAAYLAQLEVPVVRPPGHEKLYLYYENGREAFDVAKCASCHIPSLDLIDPMITIASANQNARPVEINVALDGESPKTAYDASRKVFRVALFSDLKRHDMGENLASESIDGDIPKRLFLTRPLWGLAETAPYLHDGRANDIDEAIRLHEGEASASKDLYLAMSKPQQAALQIFLLSLSRTPHLELH
jgi:hypothetical protein